MGKSYFLNKKKVESKPSILRTEMRTNNFTPPEVDMTAMRRDNDMSKNRNLGYYSLQEIPTNYTPEQGVENPRQEDRSVGPQS